MLHNFKIKIWKIIKYNFKIRSWDYLKSKINRKFAKLVFKKKYDTKDLIFFLKSMGLKKGDTILLHSSWDEFYNYTDTIHDFIEGLIDTVGTEGTIVMPAYPLLRKSNSVFDLRTTPTAAGLIAEEFRKYPGVIRSINRHSVCALGPNAEYLVNEHKFSITSWDEHSPYYKLGNVYAKVFSIGLGSSFVGTIMHVADSILRTKYEYFEQFFTKKISTVYRLHDKSIIKLESLIAEDDFELFFTNRYHSKIIRKYYQKDKFQRCRFSNLTVNQYDANYFINQTIKLASKGIVVYSIPNPKKYFK